MSRIEPKTAQFSYILGKFFANLGLFLPCFSVCQKIAYLCSSPGGGEYLRPEYSPLPSIHLSLSSSVPQSHSHSVPLSSSPSVPQFIYPPVPLSFSYSVPQSFRLTTSIVPVFLDYSQPGLIGYPIASVPYPNCYSHTDQTFSFPPHFCGSPGWEKPGTTFD